MQSGGIFTRALFLAGLMGSLLTFASAARAAELLSAQQKQTLELSVKQGGTNVASDVKSMLASTTLTSAERLKLAKEIVALLASYAALDQSSATKTSLTSGLQAAIAALPSGNAGTLAGVAATSAPGLASDITRTAVLAAPNEAGAVTKAVIQAAPDARADIISSAKAAAPDKIAAIDAAVDSEPVKTGITEAKPSIA